MLKFGIAGFGLWGRNYVKAIEATGIAQLKRVWLRNESPARPIAQQLGLEIVDSIDGLIGLDAVIVALHPSASPQACIYLLGNGVPVMVEKPVTLNLGVANAVAQAAESSKLPFLVNHQHLFSKAFETMRDRLAGESSFSIIAHAGNLGPFRDYSAWWDYGPHDVAMCLALAEEMPSSISALCTQDGVGMKYQVTFAFAGKRVNGASLAITNGRLPKTRLFQAGQFLYNDMDPENIRLKCNGRPVDIPNHEPPLTRACRRFAETVLDGTGNDYRFGGKWARSVTDLLTQGDVASS